jgi:hypothetical protein
MDDVAHSSPSLSQLSLPRKRKADGEDPIAQDCQCPSSPEPMAVDASECLPRNPSHPCWSSNPQSDVWSPSPAPSAFDTDSNIALEHRQREHKRPRIQVPNSIRKRSHARRTSRLNTEVADTGVISAASAGPSKGSLLRPSHKSFLPTIDWNSPNIPPAQPIPNRDTLKELDLEAILRNPQLRA